jgi:hypothetical protein
VPGKAVKSEKREKEAKHGGDKNTKKYRWDGA